MNMTNYILRLKTMRPYRIEEEEQKKGSELAYVGLGAWMSINLITENDGKFVRILRDAEWVMIGMQT